MVCLTRVAGHIGRMQQGGASDGFSGVFEPIRHSGPIDSMPGTMLQTGAPAMPPSDEPKATQMLGVCETCQLVVRVPTADIAFRQIVERKCPRCNTTSLQLPQEVMEMLVLFGNYVPDSVAATVALSTLGMHPSLRADFVASVMNELLVPLQTDYVYDVAVPKREEGLGMSLRMNGSDMVVGGFVDFENNSESPTVAARIISVGDVLVAINKKSITSSSFEDNIKLLASAASPVYLTFRRQQPVTML